MALAWVALSHVFVLVASPDVEAPAVDLMKAGLEQQLQTFSAQHHSTA